MLHQFEVDEWVDRWMDDRLIGWTDEYLPAATKKIPPLSRMLFLVL